MTLESATRDFQLNPEDSLVAERYLKTVARHAGIKTLASCQFHEPSAKNWKCVLLSLAEIPEAARETCLRAFECVLSDWPIGLRVLPRWSECTDGGFESVLSIASLARFGAFQLIDSLELDCRDLPLLYGGMRSLRELTFRESTQRLLDQPRQKTAKESLVKLGAFSPLPNLTKLVLPSFSSHEGNKKTLEIACYEFFFGECDFVAALPRSIKHLSVDGSCEKYVRKIASSNVLLQFLEEIEIRGIEFGEILNWKWSSLKKAFLRLEQGDSFRGILQSQSLQSIKSLECLDLKISSKSEADQIQQGRIIKQLNSACQVNVGLVIDSKPNHDFVDLVRDQVQRVNIVNTGLRPYETEFPRLEKLFFAPFEEYSLALTRQEFFELVSLAPNLSDIRSCDVRFSQFAVSELLKAQRNLRFLGLGYDFKEGGAEAKDFLRDLAKLKTVELSLGIEAAETAGLAEFRADFSELKFERLDIFSTLSFTQFQALFESFPGEVHSLILFYDNLSTTELQQILNYDCLRNVERLIVTCTDPEAVSAVFWRDLQFPKLVELGNRTGASNIYPKQTLKIFETWPSLVKLW